MQLTIEEIHNDISKNDLSVASFDFNNLINEINHVDDERISQLLNYKLNYTIKELFKICEYYKIDKCIKQCKCSKDDIIGHIVTFESEVDNNECVARRQSLWFCINELKNDKYMKKYVIW